MQMLESFHAGSGFKSRFQITHHFLYFQDNIYVLALDQDPIDGVGIHEYLFRKQDSWDWIRDSIATLWMAIYRAMSTAKDKI